MNGFDYRLLNLAANGDNQAFEKLIVPHERMMYALALRLCQNKEDAEDCLQDAMIRVYKSLSSFRGDSAFSTWLYRIVTNTCLDSHRRRKHRYSESLDSLSESGWNAPDPGLTPEQSAVNRDLKRALNEAINTLPGDIRAAVVLRDVQGFSYEDVSEILGINIGTVKSRLSRGREKIRSYLTGRMEL